MEGLEEKESSYGLFERFLYIFLIPLLFTGILIVALLSLFDYDVKHTVLNAANKIPLVSSIVPDPKEKALNTTDSGSGDSTSAASQKAVEQLQAKMAVKDAEVNRLMKEQKQKDERIAELQAQLKALQSQNDQKKQSLEEYEKKIQGLANMYAGMSASKAAPILENLTQSELVLVLSHMQTDAQVRILEKMDPKIAAAASIQMKDTVNVKDEAISALQQRLQINAAPSTAAPGKLSITDLGTTFANMTASSAADVLLEMYKKDSAKVVQILNAMGNAGRSKVLDAMAAADKATAARISSALGK